MIYIAALHVRRFLSLGCSEPLVLPMLTGGIYLSIIGACRLGGRYQGC